MNNSSQYNTVIFVDCGGLTPQSDAGLTDKAPPSSAACCRNRTPVDSLETQQQTSPIDLLHFWLITCPRAANSAANAFYNQVKGTPAEPHVVSEESLWESDSFFVLSLFTISGKYLQM